MRDQLAVCHYFARKAEIDKEVNPGGGAKDKRQKRQSSPSKKKGMMQDESAFEDIFDDTNDWFFDAQNEKSLSQANETRESYPDGFYQTEQAFHNDLESELSISERSAKLL